MTKRSMLAAIMMTLGMAIGTVATPALADDHEINFQMIYKMADKNSDSMVTKEELLDAVAKAYDMKMAKMKTMPNSSAMMKGNAMTREGLRLFFNDIHHGA